MVKNANWTFMVYLAGDNNLSEAGDMDLEEMREVGSTEDVNVIAQFDNAGNLGTNRYRIQKGGDDLVEELGETDSGSPEVLNDFIAWAVDSYPADHHALILWNHGGGWEPTEMDKIAKRVKARNYNVRETSRLTASPLKRVLFSSTIKKILKENTASLRAICSDDGTGHSLDTIELGNVLALAKDRIGKPLDILGMDACLMSNYEVAYQAAPYADYIVTSEETEPGEGWPYNSILSALVKKPDCKPGPLSDKVVQLYIDYYRSAQQSDVTQSSFDLSRVKDNRKSIDGLAGALLDHMPDAADEIMRAQTRSMNFFYRTLWDINHFAKELADITENEEVKEAATDIQKSLEPGSSNFVLSNSYLGSNYDKCGGISIYLIPPFQRISSYYPDLEFNKDDNTWLRMLEEYHKSI